MSAVCAAVRFPEARFCWSDCKACCDAETLLEAATYWENAAVDRAAMAMMALLRERRLRSLMSDSSSLAGRT